MNGPWNRTAARTRRSWRDGGVGLLARRAGWSTVDQVISSLSNFALSVLVARQVTVSEYGAFALSFALYGYLVTVSRLLVSQPLAIRFSGANPDEFAHAARQSTGAAIVVALVPAAGMTVAGVWVGGTVGPTLITTAVLLPGLLLQDSWRTVFFARGHPRAAAANDAAWGVAQVVFVLAVAAAAYASAVGYLLAWGLAGYVAATLGAVQAGLLPAPREAWRWLAAHWDLSRYFVSELVAINGATQLMLVLVAAIGGLAVTGALRGAQVLTGPVNILALSGMAFVIPELARRHWIVGRRLLRAGLAVSAVVVVLATAWGLLLLALPDVVGEQLLGRTWASVDSILVPTVIGTVISVASLGPTCGVYAMKRPRVLFPLQLMAAPAFLIGGVGGVLIGGAFGAATGIALAYAFNAGMAWVRFIVVARLTATARDAVDPGVGGNPSTV
jgi:O-antigen/teichoic acid export membrane protein